MKRILSLFLVIMVTGYIYSQGTKSTRQPVNNNEVPKNVKQEFKIRYPDAFVKMWFITHISYWYQDYGPTYYNGWYPKRTVYVYNFKEAPNYEVEFLSNDENSRAIFNRYGAWFETRTRILYLPENIIEALEKSEFAHWNLSEFKERIEAPGMPGSVYRMQVSHKNRSEIIRINESGKIIQIKTE